MAALDGVQHTVDADEDGVWCARAQLGDQGFAHGDGDTQKAALADLADAVAALLAVLGEPVDATVEAVDGTVEAVAGTVEPADDTVEPVRQPQRPGGDA